MHRRCWRVHLHVSHLHLRFCWCRVVSILLASSAISPTVRILWFLFRQELAAPELKRALVADDLVWYQIGMERSVSLEGARDSNLTPYFFAVVSIFFRSGGSLVTFTVQDWRKGLLWCAVHGLLSFLQLFSTLFSSLFLCHVLIFLCPLLLELLPTGIRSGLCPHLLQLPRYS